MFIAMNRFKVARGSEEVFEEMWRNRDSYLDDVPGFKTFNLLKGPANDEYTLYSSHSTWANRDAFDAWTESEAFQKAHSQARAPQGTYLSHPDFEGFEVIL
ncbi:MAG: antibiotic biosynthesis monooxygenase [Acidobacteria bacterium]|nr:antibiotic biosynthesis monooxygenase [Acidobacteriota bacterium]